MIYLDTSISPAQLLAGDRIPPEQLWSETLISSRLLEYEVWNRVNARRLATSHGDTVRALLARVSLLELAPPVLMRALEPFPAPVRTLDALHLASIEFLRSRGQDVALASYDERLSGATRRLGIASYRLPSR